MPALHLSHKLFLAFALIVGVVLSLAAWSLFTARRLAAENLFAAITHDLRTPLTVIARSSERLGKEAPGMLRDRQASLVENIRMNTDRLLSLRRIADSRGG